MNSSPSGDDITRPESKRVGSGVLLWTGGIILLLVMLPFLLGHAFRPGQSEVRGAADAAAYELERTPVKGLGLTIFDIQQALEAGTRGTSCTRGGCSSLASELRAKDAGKDSRGDLYEITNSGGDHPVCLAVKVDIDLLDSAPSFPTTSVTDGPCRPA